MTSRATALSFFVLIAVALGALGCARNRELVDDNEMLLDMARDRIADRRFLEAIRLLGDVGLLSPVSEALDPEVKLALAEAYFYQSGGVETIEAQSRFEQFISFYPTHPQAARARYMVGVCLFRQAESPENDQEFSIKALQHFRAMMQDLPPGSPWQQPAREMFVKAQNRLAEHEWQVAKFYLDGDRHPGAIGRLQTLIERYPESMRREEAFFLLANSFRSIGDVEQARLNLDRMLAEYGEGPFADRARALRSEIEGRAAALDEPGQGSSRAAAR